jgi:hypothetical protein
LHYLKAVAAAGTTDATKVVAKMKELPIDDFYYGARGRACDAALLSAAGEEALGIQISLRLPQAARHGPGRGSGAPAE